MTAEFGEIICFRLVTDKAWDNFSLFLVLKREGRLVPLEHLNVAQKFREKQYIP